MNLLRKLFGSSKPPLHQVVVSAPARQAEISSEDMWRKGGQTLFRSKGGEIRYSGHGLAFSISFELGLSTMLIYLPKVFESVPDDERQQVLKELSEWLLTMGYVAKPPEALEEEDEQVQCLRKGCERRRLKHRYVCRYHYLEGAPRVERTLEYFRASDVSSA